MKTTLQKQLVRIVCVLLTLALSLGAFAACKGSEDTAKKKKKKKSSKTETTSSESYLSEGDDDLLIEEEYPEEEEEDDLWEDEEPEEEEEEPEEEFEGVYDTVQIQNGSDPILKNYMGLTGIYQCFTYIPDGQGRNYTEEQAAIEYNRVKAMKLDNVRTYYSPIYAYENGAFNFESDAMKGIYRWAKEMAAANVDIQLNTGWNVKTLRLESIHGFSLPGVFVKDNFDASLRNYGDWMVQSLNAFRAHGVNNIKYLIMFTEPEEFPRHQILPDQKLEDLSDPAFEDWFAASKALDAALKTAGIRSNYKLVGPNSTGTTYTADGIYVNPLFSQAVRFADDYIDIYSNHTYLWSTQDQTADTVATLVDPAWRDHAAYAKTRTGKECWVDEYNIIFDKNVNGIGHARQQTWFALHHAVALATGIQCGIQNQVLWTIADQQWPDSNSNDVQNEFFNGVQCHGVLPSMFQSTVPYISYYGISLLTRYFGNNATAYNTTATNLYSAAQVDENGTLSVLAVNMDPVENTKVTVEFEKNVGHTVLYRHLYDTNNQVATADAKLIGIDKVIHCYGESFTDIVPPGSMAVYTTTKD